MMKFFLNCVLVFILIHTSVSLAQTYTGDQNDRRARTIYDSTLVFNGSEPDLLSMQNLSEIRIGVFFPVAKDSSMLDALQFAANEINRSGGIHGIPVSLYRRWADDPWRDGSRQIIKLVYEDSVLAIIGSVEGHATHIAEQIATKAWVPLLSPVSADPTLNYIRIPWMFSLPPDFMEQSRLIVQDGLRPLDDPRIGIITSANHDGKEFSRTILKAMGEEYIVPAFHMNIKPVEYELNKMIERILSFEPGALIVYLPPQQMQEFLLLWGQQDRPRMVFYLPWIPGLSVNDIPHLPGASLFLVRPFIPEQNPVYATFYRTYTKYYHNSPSPAASYMYDSVMLLCNAIKISGPNRPRLRHAISKMSGFKGVTGQIVWDQTGGNLNHPVLVKLQ